MPPTDPDLFTSATDPEWGRERPRRFWDPGPKLIRSIRAYQALAGKGGLAPLRRRGWVLVHRFWSVVTQAEIHLTTQIGGGLRIPHPNGIVIHPDAVIGPNCTIMAQVTLGVVRGGGAPVIGGHVDIGAGARLLRADPGGRSCPDRGQRGGDQGRPRGACGRGHPGAEPAGAAFDLARLSRSSVRTCRGFPGSAA
jgi:serine O-acetyltransferase